VKQGFEVIAIDNFDPYYDPERKERNLTWLRTKNNFTFEEIDIRNFESLEKLFKKHNIEQIVHLAAKAGVRRSIEIPLAYQSVNVEGTLNLLELSRINDIERFIFGSSSSVYGDRSSEPFSENDRTDKSVSPYAATKKAGEVLCYSYYHLYSLKMVCLRFFTVYGPRGRPDMAPFMFLDWISKGQTLTMYGDGSTSRDYTFVSDIVTGIVASLHAPLSYEIINLGRGEPILLRDFIQTIEEVVERKANIKQLPMNPGDVPHTLANIDKAKRLLDYHPRISVRDGMQEMYNWYQQEFNRY
ncbi:MAG: GDP-mannose 4,6-dehydratase, partial [Promethearchaeota archaeon]